MSLANVTDWIRPLPRCCTSNPYLKLPSSSQLPTRFHSILEHISPPSNPHQPSSTSHIPTHIPSTPSSGRGSMIAMTAMPSSSVSSPNMELRAEGMMEEADARRRCRRWRRMLSMDWMLRIEDVEGEGERDGWRWWKWKAVGCRVRGERPKGSSIFAWLSWMVGCKSAEGTVRCC